MNTIDRSLHFRDSLSRGGGGSSVVLGNSVDRSPYSLIDLTFILSEISKRYIVSFLQVSNSFLSPIFS